MKFLWTSIYVKNLDESITFYTDLMGLKVVNRFRAGPELEIAFMGNGTTDETLVELMVDRNSCRVNFNEFISIGFAVDSVDTMLETVKNKGITVQSGPFDTPGSKFFSIKDPNGLLVQFFQQKKL